MKQIFGQAPIQPGPLAHPDLRISYIALEYHYTSLSSTCSHPQ